MYEVQLIWNVKCFFGGGTFYSIVIQIGLLRNDTKALGRERGVELGSL